jgi:SET domain-containing protein
MCICALAPSPADVQDQDVQLFTGSASSNFYKYRRQILRLPCYHAVRQAVLPTATHPLHPWLNALFGIEAAPIMVEVRPVPSMGAGHSGLFAARSIPKSTVVVTMTDQGRLPRHQWPAYRDHFQLPDDAKIESWGMHTVFYSTSWINPAAPPLWYYMNHSSLPNVVMRIANPDGPVPQQRLVWVAVRDIAAGDEIRFYYFDAPASWV